MISWFLACAPTLVDLVDGPTLPAASTRWILVGDAGRATPSRDLLLAAIDRTCRDRGCDAIWLLGDNVYDRGFESPDDPRAAQLLKPWLGLPAPVWWVVGNHDHGWWVDHRRVRHQLEWAARQGGVAPGPAYRAELGPASVVVLDSTELFWLGDAGQGDAAHRHLAASAQPWRVLFTHHPLYSFGPHGSAGRYEGLPHLPWVSGRSVEETLGALARGPANLLIAAHDHNRQVGGDEDAWWIVSGAGATSQPLRAPIPEGVIARDGVGFHWLELTQEGATLLFIDPTGQVEEDLRLPRPQPRPSSP